MKYLLLIIMLSFSACEEKRTAPWPASDCRSAYEFKISADSELPVACHTTGDTECCLWELEYGKALEMCLDDSCLWQIKRQFKVPGESDRAVRIYQPDS
jgi:hypothetical protein